MIDLFKTEDQQKLAVAQFTDLMNHPGWKLYVAILDDRIKTLGDRLTNEDFLTVEQMTLVQKLRKCTEDNKNVPKVVIDMYMNPAKGEAPSLDSYEDIEEFRLNLRKARGNA
jgi:hypothetical protein